VAAEPILDSLPALVGGLHPIVGAIACQEAVSGTLVGVELERPAVLFQDLLEPLGLGGRRVAVLGAEEPEQRAAQVGGALVKRMPFGAWPDDAGWK
jgi:hypothetical protein